NFKRYAQSLADRLKLLDELIQNKSQTPEELFEQLVRGVFNPAYECGKTRVVAVDVVEDLTRELIELQLLQAVVRTELVDLQDVDLRADRALEVARRYRRDWMNSRARLVDFWRRLQFNANQLQAGLDALFNGSFSNIRPKSFLFPTGAGSLHAGIRFDAPFTPLAEPKTSTSPLTQYQQTP